jgi:ComF family protein
VESGRFLCGPCGEKVKRIKAPFCATCSQPFDGAIDGSFSCANCASRHFHFDCAVAAYRSRGIVRDIIHRFKYHREYRLRHPLAGWLAAALEDPRIQARPFDCFVPVPLHPVRQREREFNQAAELARLLEKRTGRPLLPCLRRIRYTTTQTRFDRAERMENLRNAFDLRKNTDVKDKHLLLVDDVLTTGSTVDECARMLKNAGAASIRVITVARG